METAVRRAEQGPGLGAWAQSSPAAHGLNAAALDRAAEQLAAAGERQGLVVVRGGEIAFERYWANDWHRAEPTWRNVSFSSGKSWGATMVGRAITEGLLGLDDLADLYHPAEVFVFPPLAEGFGLPAL